jgi:hypothetical protein
VSTLTTGGNGGGGGGGGAILVAVNGTARILGKINARGGTAGYADDPVWSGSNPANFRPGGAGGGGAIRLMASTVIGNTGSLDARGGNRASFQMQTTLDERGSNGGDGSIRIERLGEGQPGDPQLTGTPVAFRTTPGPVVLPVTPTVQIVSVGGQGPMAAELGGWRHTTDRMRIDIEVAAPGDVEVELATWGVPAGSNLEVSVVPYMGAYKTTKNDVKVNCPTGSVDCTAAAIFDDLAPGGYVIEARATFQ